MMKIPNRILSGFHCFLVFCFVFAMTSCSDSSKPPSSPSTPPSGSASTLASKPAGDGKTITVKGSDTMINLSQRWAEKFMKEHPEVTIQVTGGGSGTGIAALLNGTTDLANLSRPAKPKEIEKAKSEGKDLKEFKVALDGLAVVVNKDNPITELNLKQLMGIYTGQFNNWKDIGGKDAPIIRYCRESNSGTYVFFKEHVLGDRDYASDCQTLPGTAAVAEAVSRDLKGIGYGGVAYFITRPDLKVIGVKKDENTPAVSPVDGQGKINFQAIRDLSYPISRYLYVYTIGVPQGNLKSWLDWMLGADGQKTVEEIGYVSLEK